MPNKRTEEFYNSECFAIIGMSHRRRNIGWSVYDQLLKLGKRVYAINPAAETKDGVRLYPSLEALPEKPQAVIISLNIKLYREILGQIARAGIMQVWFPEGSYDLSVLDEANKLGLQPIEGCPLMYMPGMGFPHNFHRFITELFGKGQK